MPRGLLCCVRAGPEDVRELDCSRRSLSDLPSDVFVYERTLERLHCQSNHIAELPRQLFICHELKVLDLGDNELQELPAAISALANLQLLDLSKNAISALPDTIKALKQLHVLDLSVNPLEKLPEAVTNLIFLQELFLNDIYLEYLPGNFGRLTNLKILELRDNFLMILPKSMARSADLQRLDIGQNEFNDFPEVIGKFSKLRELWVDCNSLTVIPSVIENLTELIHFEAGNNLIAELPPEISCCRELVELSLSTNHLNQLPDTIGALINLVSLKLDCNKLFALPDSIGDLRNLEELILTSNFLYELPPTIGRLRKLQCLNVDENMLKEIPPEVGSCAALTVLSARSNRLTFVPGEIGHLASLKVLNLVRNSLHCLPQTLLNCGNLVALWLSENQSKPLVPMQSETDPRTCQQVLTCFLFPQAALAPVDISTDDRKSYMSEATAASRHISFVDMKAAAKSAAERPGQLRRAPTPYPKELRALAKHARSIQKDAVDDASLAMQNAVHIKAAKITPTLQQRFASNHPVSGIVNAGNDWYDAGVEEPLKRNVDSSFVNTENPYDKPVNLDRDKSYQNLDQTLYSESNDSAYGGFTEQSSLRAEEHQYGETLSRTLERDTIEDRVDGIIQQSSHDLYAPSKANTDKRISPVIVPSFEILSSGNRNSISSNVSQSNQSYQKSRETLHYDQNYPETKYGSVKSQHCPIENVSEHAYRYINDASNESGTPYIETYAQAKEKIYGRRRDDIYGHHPAYQANCSYAEKPPTPINMDRVHPETQKYNHFGNDRAYYPNSEGVPCSTNNYSNNSVQHKLAYGPPNNCNSEASYETNSVSSKQGIHPRANNMMPYYNPPNIYESVPNANRSVGAPQQVLQPSGNVSPSKTNPPPYHIAATYSKQAHFFHPNS